MKSLIFVGIVGTAFSAKWDRRNNPQNTGAQYKYKLSDLPTEAHLSRSPWSDTYWPSYESGIAHRWNSNNANDFKYSTLTQDQVKNATEDQLKELSPAEKYDIFLGRYDYPTVKSEWDRTHATDATWEGLCHGWAPAASWYKEPNPITIKNPDGVDVPFGSSDIKALLTYYAGNYAHDAPDFWFISGRCSYDLKSNPSMEKDPDCNDQNAGTFHVVLANQVGVLDKAFVVDRDRSIQVWNQPVYRYKSEITSPGPARIPEAASHVNVTTSFTYGKETWPNWNSHGTYEVTEDYNYALDLDKDGNIIGGDQFTWDRVDFAWRRTITPFFGYFEKMGEVYKAATGEEVPNAEINPDSMTASSMNTVRLDSEIGHVGFGPYERFYTQIWEIAPEGADAVELIFENIDTERHWDFIRIYEGADGQGALVSVLHGKATNKHVIVNGPSVRVVFTSADSAKGTGFNFVYKALRVIA